MSKLRRKAKEQAGESIVIVVVAVVAVVALIIWILPHLH